LAKGADILVSELVDAQVAGSMVAPASGTDAEKKRFQVMKQHLSTHHLTPEQIGKMASEAKVGRVVITHLVPSRKPDVATDSYVIEIRKSYSGPDEVADDLNRY
jgi:ribonuclease BN (tRNA processing enzyme)